MTDTIDLYADPRAAANAASVAVRALNHATLDTTSLAPGDVYAVLGALVEMMQRTPQAIGQLLAALQHHHDAGTLAHDSLPIDQVMVDVDDEAVNADQCLDAAHSALATIHQNVSGISQR